ncbi:major facilitator superfamily domain-containing protein 6-like [Betta splendens]|uniref:Major facilitator superfamily domain-containing protein 6-like n=1 Tax=Betta splendens TaxID=158456 RepID=A0A6P7N4U8_BETSP|nr:major facilitator superfamily domain-containing protein 6-like [Betta splendens]
MMTSNKQIDVRRALVLSGAFSFLCSGARFCLLPFLTLCLRRWGLSPVLTGCVLGTKHLVTLLWSPAAALLSQHYDRRRTVICGSLVCSAAAALVLLLIPSVGVHTQNYSCNTSDPGAGPTLNVTNGTAPTAEDVGEQNAESDDTTMTPSNISEAVTSNISSVDGSEGTKVAQKSDVHSGFLAQLQTLDPRYQLFFLVLMAVLVWELVSAPLDWTVDDGLYEYLDFAEAADRHGGARLWALLGAACGAGSAGLLVSLLSCLLAHGAHRSAVHFYTYGAVTVLALPVATYLPLYLNQKRNRAAGLLKAVRLVCGSPRALLCGATTLLAGAAGSAVDDFLLWQMQDHGSSELHMGLGLSAALLTQASFPLLAGLASKLLSPARVLVLGAAGLALQCFYYSLLWGPWAALPGQLLGGVGAGAFWWAVSVQSEEVAAPGAERSVGRVYAGLCLPLGRSLGSFAGGLLAQRLGLPWLFRGAALVLMLWCLVLPLLQCQAPHQRRINYSRLLAADASEASDSESEQDGDGSDMSDDRSNKNRSGRKPKQWID